MNDLDRAKASFFQGLDCLDAGNLAAAGDFFRATLAIMPQHGPSLNNLAIVYFKQDRIDELARVSEAALAADPGNLDAHRILANCCKEQERWEEALVHLRQVTEIDPNNAEAFVNQSFIFNRLKKFEESLASSGRALAIDANYRDAYINKGSALRQLKRYQESLEAYDIALGMDDRSEEAWIGRANTLVDAKRYGEAVDSCKRALALNAGSVDALIAYGNALAGLKRYSEAAAAYETAIARKPDLAFITGDYLWALSVICDWRQYDERMERILAAVMRGEELVPPFGLFSVADDPELHRMASATFARSNFSGRSSLPDIGRYAGHERIRVGYFSADFCNHAVAYHIAELIERHDRSKFEIVGFSFGADDASAMRKRLSRGFDRFIDVAHLSDDEVALLARSNEIDIAIDLMGFTTESRTGIFAARAAPVQASYIGFPGTMAADCYDYLIADPVVIPQTQRAFYTEKIAYLPHSYQANDTRREISSAPVSRAQYGLPEKAFVFCSFNSVQKINPQVFDDWMTILKRVEGSVLWLFTGHVDAERNLLREAQARGVPRDRLVIAPRVSMPEHLARHRLADLFLDTFPYNGHATSSNALWAGLPLLARQGDAFAGRVAASLLQPIA
jgi:predicted O-linked N-acetylglucosamine transferase (SPINDLY family)